MSYFDDLLSRYCPDGVVYKTLGELGSFYGGLTGKSKKDFENGNAVFISYRNVYSNPALDIHPLDRVRIYEGEKQRTLQYGDVIFTGSSETPDECGFSSVVTEKPTEPLYLNSFCFFFRMYNPEMLLPDFAKHLFRSGDLRNQIGKTASGVTRFNVSKGKMQLVEVPVPPLEVQREIVRILDIFTELTAELTTELASELTARKKQYEYYSQEMLINGVSDYVSIANLGKWMGGKTPSMDNPDYWTNGIIPWISSKDMKAAVLSDTQDHITEEAVSGASMKMFPAGTVAIVTRSGILKHTFPVVYVPFETTINQDIKALIPAQNVSGRYVSLVMQAFSEDIRTKTKKQGGTVDSLDFKKVLEYEIPLPSYENQMELVNKLESFDMFTNSLVEGLPVEIEARTKQYEYYRDKLLTFKRKETA